VVEGEKSSSIFFGLQGLENMEMNSQEIGGNKQDREVVETVG